MTHFDTTNVTNGYWQQADSHSSVLSDNRIFCELQQELFGSGILESDGCLGILAGALNTLNSADAEALVLDDAALPKSHAAQHGRLRCW